MVAVNRRQQRGFTLVEMIVVVAVLGILAAIVVPALIEAVQRSRQRRTMADMHNLATANAVAQVDTGRFVPALANLAPNYLLVVPTNDGWGTPFVYAPGGGQLSYTLTSFGRDQVAGPAPPTPWFNDPFEPDLIMNTGQFTQSPEVQ